MGEAIGTLILIIILIALIAACIALYFTPTIIAVKNNHSSKTTIILINVFLGWTFAGWVATFVWALDDSVYQRNR
ncbi:MAG: superinfection immunity protein [Oscillospiraceae bacterium]|nr:superinfection immunity protein [Oscillospiraceae bacterium]